MWRHCLHGIALRWWPSAIPRCLAPSVPRPISFICASTAWTGSYIATIIQIDELKDWAVRLEPHLKGRVLYAFFNNDFQANAPRNAETFRSLLEKI